MPSAAPNFSPYPFARLRKTTRADAAFESAFARHLAARPRPFAKLEKLVGAPVHAQIIGAIDSNAARDSSANATRATSSIDPHAARAEVRFAGDSIIAIAPSLPIRTLAQRWLGGPDELAAPRPLTVAEHAIWCLVVASALADLAIDAQVWPLLDEDRVPRSPALASTLAAVNNAFAETKVARPVGGAAGARSSDTPGNAARSRDSDLCAIEIAVALGDLAMTVVAYVPLAIELRAPAARPIPAWSFDLPIVLARAAVPREAVAQLAIRDIITVERTLELEIGDGAVSLSAAPGALEAKVATGYVPRDMALPDEAHLELSVQLGTTRLSLRQLAELAVGQVIPLGRPLSGPFEVRAGGRVVGQGELIDIDGELGVRIVSLAQE